MGRVSLACHDTRSTTCWIWELATGDMEDIHAAIGPTQTHDSQMLPLPAQHLHISAARTHSPGNRFCYFIVLNCTQANRTVFWCLLWMHHAACAQHHANHAMLAHMKDDLIP